MLVEHTIDIPRISVVPKGPVKSGYQVFKLDLSKMNFQPQDMALIGQGLKTGKQVLYGQSSTVMESQLENYIVRELINYDDVSYDEHAELIYELSGQAVAHFRTYVKTDEEFHNILGNYGKTIAENIHLQMALHYYEIFPNPRLSSVRASRRSSTAPLPPRVTSCRCIRHPKRRARSRSTSTAGSQMCLPGAEVSFRHRTCSRLRAGT